MTRNETGHTARALAGLWLLACSSGALAATDADTRFHGTGKADPIRIANVTCQPGESAGTGSVTFDLAWDHSWRAAWEVPEEQHGGKGALKLENWDAAWVFVKFRKPGATVWGHATLSTRADEHKVSAGAKLDVGLSDDGKRGLGVFVYRGAAGSGPNNWKGVTLRWLHGADGVGSVDKVSVAVDRKPSGRPPKTAPKAQSSFDAVSDMDDEDDADGLGAMFDEADAAANAAAETKRKDDKMDIRVCAIRMVYVPECAFWVGDGTKDRIAGQFTAGDTTDPFRIESENAIAVGGESRKNLGNNDGVMAFDDFTSALSRPLPARFPSGYAAFYCMKHEVTRGEIVTFLNTPGAGRADTLKAVVGAANNGVKLEGSGALAAYVTSAPNVACDGLSWGNGTAFAAWAGLRPMTELEYEKACRGPLRPVPGEYAWGTARIAGTNSKDPPHDGYKLLNSGKADERVAWEGANGPDSARGNAAWTGTMIGRSMGHGGTGYAANHIARPLRVGIFAEPDSDRVTAGASYWGVMELTGSLWEHVVAVGHHRGRRFTGSHGNGTLAEPRDWHALGMGAEPAVRPRGGAIGAHGGVNPQRLWVSDRGQEAVGVPEAVHTFCGLRCVRTVAAGIAPAGPPDESGNAAIVFNEKLRIENLTVAPRNAKTATIKFDIAWEDSWRDVDNYDAAWVFFKVRARGRREWQHVELAADRALNPTGYGQGEGTPLELIVPTGKDGSTGVFVQRAKKGTGPLSARGVTAVWDLSQDKGIKDIGKAQVQAFGIEMVYVAEGPFYLGSGGTEANHFYKYTDGSQNTEPYRVTDAGAIPTGPQRGRLWATGVTPDGGDSSRIPAAFPNGYRAFYCMKYPIKEGQFAAFLDMQSAVVSDDHAYRTGDWPVRTIGRISGAGLTWWQGAGFGAWAGLRPMSELEYEKACRGLREPSPHETGPSFWGIEYLNVGAPNDHAVAVGHPAGRKFAGTHGPGTPTLPKDWPSKDGEGSMLRGGGLTVHSPFRQIPVSYRNACKRDGDINLQFVRLPNCDYNGWRGVRSAPEVDAVSPQGKPTDGRFVLEMDPLPDLRELDIAIFYLSGRVRHSSDKAQKVELTLPFPDACFPGGAAARAFTAAPKTKTPFRILTVLTHLNARAARKVQTFPVRIQVPGGDVLAETSVHLPLIDPLAVRPPVVGSLAGGAVELRITNSTDRAQALTITLRPPQDMKISKTSRRVDVAARAEARVSFPVPGQLIADPGFRAIPYQVAAGSGAAQDGEMIAEFRVQSRWWISRRRILTAVEKEMEGKSLESSDDMDDLDGLDGMMEDLGPSTSAAAPDKNWAVPPDLFKSGTRPKLWQAVTHGAALWVPRLKPLPSQNTVVLAATKVTAPADRKALVRVVSESASYTWIDGRLAASRDWGLGPRTRPFFGRILFNGEVVYDSRPEAKESRRPARIRQGENTMLVQCKVNASGPDNVARVFVLFVDAKTEMLITDLVLDAGK